MTMQPYNLKYHLKVATVLLVNSKKMQPHRLDMLGAVKSQLVNSKMLQALGHDMLNKGFSV